MTTVTLYPGAVTTSGSATGSLVGSGAVWADASDATYLDTSAAAGSGLTFAGTASLDVLSLPSGATVNSVTVNMRASGETDSAANPFVNVEIFASGVDIGVSWPVGVLPTTGVPQDVSRVLSTEYASWGVSLDDLVAALSSGASILAYSLSPHTSGTMHEHVYELSVTVDYSGGSIDTPCDTDVALDLSTATFVTDPSSDSDPGPFGQYSDGVIWPLPDPGGGSDYYPDFTLGLTLDAVKKFRVTIAFDPDSAHDGGGRSVLLLGIPSGQSTVPTGPPTFYDGTGNTDDTVTVTIGPGIGDWDDPTNGVAAGWNGLWFETSNAGAVSAITIRKVCTTFAPPLRLTNRDDMFASARRLTGSRSRQGSSRLTGYL